MPENKPPLVDTQAIMQGGIDANNSVLFIDGEITIGLASYVARAMHLFKLNHQPVTLFLNTPGGSCDAAFGMYDLIQSCKEHVTIIGYGEVASAGVLILQAGDTRLLTKNCRVLVHPGYASVGEDMMQNVINNTKSHQVMSSMFYSVIGKSMGLTTKEMNQKYTWDTWLSSSKAVRVGLADRIVK